MMMMVEPCKRNEIAMKCVKIFITAYDYLLNHENCSGKIGVVGFCFGGWISNIMAVKVPNLSAAVPFYGRQPSDEEAALVKAAFIATIC